MRPGTSRHGQEDLGGGRLPQGSFSWFPERKDGMKAVQLMNKTPIVYRLLLLEVVSKDCLSGNGALQT